MTVEAIGFPQEVLSPAIDYTGIEKALNLGDKLEVRMTDTGIYIANLIHHGNLTGYGNNLRSAEEAMSIASRDYLSGGKNRQFTFSDSSVVTGEPGSEKLNWWLRRGGIISAHASKINNFIINLIAWRSQTIPEEISKKAKLNDSSVCFEDRGYKFSTTHSLSFKIEEAPEGRNPLEGYMFHIKKTGKGESFTEAINIALSAKEEEIINYRPTPFKYTP